MPDFDDKQAKEKEIRLCLVKHSKEIVKCYIIELNDIIVTIIKEPYLAEDVFRYNRNSVVFGQLYESI